MQKKATYIVLIFLMSTIFAGCMEETTSLSNCAVIEGKGNYKSIQDAIDAASEGDTINVYNGTYYELLVINKSINLIGESNKDTIIEFNEKRYNEFIEAKKNITPPIDIIKINAENTTIKGFKIIVNDFNSDFRGIGLSSSKNTISNNTISNVMYGIHVYSNSKNNIISHNLITNNQYGIYLNHASENNIVSNNVSSNDKYGIWILSGSNNNKVFQNIISNNSKGIRLKGVHSNFIYENKIANNYEIGVYVCCGANNNYIYKNSLIKNKVHAEDAYSNQWYYNNVGNYWDNYEEKYPDAKDDNDDGIWDTPYRIPQGVSNDVFPLLMPPI